MVFIDKLAKVIIKTIYIRIERGSDPEGISAVESKYVFGEFPVGTVVMARPLLGPGIGKRMTQDSERIVGLYERHAHAFDKDRVRILFEKVGLERFRALIPQGGSVLDLGCGMGEPIARYLIEGGYALTGVDSSPSMIALCGSRFPDQAWRVADMRSLALARRFDGIIAWDSFFHLIPDDQRRMFPVFAAHAAPNAALMFTSGPSHGESMGVYQGEKLYHASLDAAEYRALLAQSGFAVEAHTADDPDCGGHTIWLARRD